MHKGIFYLSIFVSDLERSKRFYGETLGWKLGTNESYVAGFHFGTGYLVVLAEQRPAESRQYGGGMHAEVMVDDVVAEHARLKALHVDVSEVRTQPWGERNFSFRDPDGYTWWFGQPS
jgi:catechol 2,3-dioxygenase-like lactoylglutathione lyase family enzyme